ncbi:SGNH/GDSL hydrolase family protein [Streptomyces sp. bgisy027]|uniref:SGNH/GDSL hydrolase family protein n=1 Tax=Streptomyces sp. bgisy027 TaxID=3413770 RepID=UPI003D75F92F
MRPWFRRIPTVLGYAAAVLAVAALSVWLSVRVTPLQTVTPVGQTVQVGAATPDLSMSGPGELELFGQVIPTQPRFEGPIRPRLKLTHISFNAQATALTKPGGAEAAATDLSRQLTAAWTRYLLWETLVATGFAALIAIAVAGIRRSSRTTMLKMLGVAVAGVCALNALGVYLLASATPAALRQVRGIEDLVGPSTPTPVQAVGAPARPGVQAVVLGDSTAAGIGNAPLDDPTPTDKACGRSKDAYAVYLAAANNWNTLNLACSGATVRDGLLGPQQRGTTEVPPQLAVALKATKASVIIVSIGANDIHWSTMTALCAAAKTCDDKASTAYFQQQINAFSADYYDLLDNLAALPQHPRVLINEYYNPFGERLDCLKNQNITTAKTKTLKYRLDELNSVLRQGAQTFGFTAVPQHFDGHRLCSKQPFVQGLDANAPLHPNAAGELAIALADQQALSRTGTSTGTGTGTPTPSAGAWAGNKP